MIFFVLFKIKSPFVTGYTLLQGIGSTYTVIIFIHNGNIAFIYKT